VSRAARELFWLADELLDRVPAYEDGRWYRRGDWGCRLGLHRWWWPETDEVP
jgi:hypothetical protein